MGAAHADNLEPVTDALHACNNRTHENKALHPIRRDTPDQKGCNAYGSGAPCPHDNHDCRRFLPTHPNRQHRREPHIFEMLVPAPNERLCTI